MEENRKDGESGGSMPVVEVRQLVKQFGKLRAVNNLSMTIQASETFGLIGPNGSGKTTLIRMPVGLVRPTDGTIRVLGRRMPDAKVMAQVGYMTQLSALYLDLTAWENMRFFANIYGLRGKEQRARIEEMLERVDLAERAHNVVGTFSGGMRQRLSLACALVFGVQVFLAGVFWPIAQLPGVLHPISSLLPLTYANEALRKVMLQNADSGAIGLDLTALFVFALVMIGLSSLTTRRQLA